MYAINRDLSRNSYLATAQHSVKVRVHGPLQLRIEARPLHPNNSKLAIDDWLRIREPARQLFWPVPITQNWPTQGQQIIGDAAHVPGHAIVKEISLDAGWHELEISGAAQDLLLNLQSRVPSLRLPVLPWLNDDSLAGQAKAELAMLTSERPWYAFWQQLEAPSTSMLTPEGQVQRWRVQSAATPLHLQPRTSSPLVAPSANQRHALQATLARQEWDILMQMPLPSDAAAVTDYAHALLWAAEQQPRHKPSLMALASDMQLRHPENTELGSVLERLLRESDWQLLPSVQSSAGQRSRAINAWEPETPALRVRRALLQGLLRQGLAADDYLLTGGNRLVLSMFHLKAGQFKLTLKNLDASAMPSQPLLAQIQLDNGHIHSVQLPASQASREINLPFAKGQSALKIWLKNGFSNQFLAVRVLDKIQGEKNASANALLQDSSERFYHVATHQEPIKLNLAGPVWLRLDQWRDGQCHSRYRLLKEEWNPIVLAPRPEQKEALFRLFTRQVSPGKPQTPGRQTEVAVMPVAPPLVNLPSAIHPPFYPPLPDYATQSNGLPDGAQEAGTWSLHGSYVQSPQAARRLERKLTRASTLETGATYRYYDVARHNWYRADLFARRLPQAGAASLAGTVSLLHDPAWQGLHLGLDASARLNIKMPENGWQFGARAYAQQKREISPVLEHQPRLALVLGKLASANEANKLTGEAENVAQDNANAANKRSSARNVKVELGDTLQYRPWQDSVVLASAKLASGRTLLPDVLSTQLSIKQLVGKSMLGVQYDASLLRSEGSQRLARNSQTISLTASSEIWLKQQHRLELGVNLQHDLRQHRNSAGVALVLHFGNGRGYRDFSPNEIRFRDLRQQRAPEGGQPGS